MASSPKNPISDFVKRQSVVVLDGGLATELEARGCDLNDELWSAKILLERPELIRKVHLDFLSAGADCITTSSYQASLTGFYKRGISDDAATELLLLSVNVAVEARDRFWSERDNRRGRSKPLVAASVGPYGAFLADGSEYTGSYGIDDDALLEFHERRWHILAGSRADLLACETIPSRQEARVLVGLIKATPGRWAWMSFSCRSKTEVGDGSKLVDVVRDCDAEPRVAAVGINCTPPIFVSSLIREARRGTRKPIIVYPNSGERYDAGQKIWRVAARPMNWEALAAEWARLGASGIGGCCRVGPAVIRTMRRRLVTLP